MNAHPYPGSGDPGQTPPGDDEGPGGVRRSGRGQGRGDGDVLDEAEAEFREWSARSRLVFTPVAAPSILGLFGFAGATFMVASNLAEWWGNALLSPLMLAPFVIFFGGLAQLLAGMWSYRARDAVATAMHGTWGAFWLGWGMLMIMSANGLLPSTQDAPRAFGFWWIVLCVVTLFGALAALADNLGLFLVLALLAAGSALLATGLIGGFHDLVIAAGWVLVASAAAAFYTAGALMLSQAFGGRVILPLGHWSLRGNIPGHRASRPIGYSGGMPGGKIGQ